jgi:hypothetical protein
MTNTHAPDNVNRKDAEVDLLGITQSKTPLQHAVREPHIHEQPVPRHFITRKMKKARSSAPRQDLRTC